MIIKADKGNTIVVGNTNDYEEKALNYPSTGPYSKIDSKKFQVVKSKVKSETCEFLKELKPFIGVSIWLTLYPQSNTASPLY